MILEYFDIAYDDMYKRWLNYKLLKVDEGNRYFFKLNEKIEIEDFKKLFYKYYKDLQFKEEFETKYPKDKLKSFVEYLFNKYKVDNFNNFSFNLEDIEDKDIREKNFYIVWLVLLFSYIVEESYFNFNKYLRAYKNKLQKKSQEDVGYEEYYTEKINNLRVIKKANISFECSNEEIEQSLINSQMYMGTPLFKFLDEDALYNIFNYPLSDYLLFLLYINKMANDFAERILKEKYSGSSLDCSKYETLAENISSVLSKISTAFNEDTSEYIFHSHYKEDGKPSDSYFYNCLMETKIFLWAFQGSFETSWCDIYESYKITQLFEPYIDLQNSIERQSIELHNKNMSENMKKDSKGFDNFKKQNKTFFEMFSMKNILNQINKED